MNLFAPIDAWIRRRVPRQATRGTALAQGSGAPGLKPIAVVTGGSEGIGLELALRFARAGHDIALVARRPDPLARAAASVRERTGREALAVALDLTDEDAHKRLSEDLRTKGYFIDVLINSAGIGISGAFAERPPEEIDTLLALNVRALTRLMRKSLPEMLERGRGGILNVASLGGYVPGPHQAAYYASKAYVISLSEAVAWEVRGCGVRVCVVSPGPVETEFHLSMGAQSALYRRLVPSMSAKRVAASGYWGYRLGRTVVAPGLIGPVAVLALRILPHILVVPVIGWLLKPRDQIATEDKRNAGRQGP